MRFDGKAALVTGATSGIGAATARAFAAAGARVLVTGRSEPRGAEVCDEIAAAGGTGAFVAADLRAGAACERVVAACLARFGRLDVLVNNAGVIYRATAPEATEAEWDETMAVNVDAAFFTTRAAWPALKAAGAGVVVNVASDAALIGAPAMVAYCASKGALLQMTRALALDGAAEGIRVNAVCPDNVETPMLAREAAQLGAEPARYLAEAHSAIPMARIARAEEVADAIVFLASDRAAFVTGAALPLDGGYTAA